MVTTQNAPNCYTVAATGHDTLGYCAHVLSYSKARYRQIEPQGYLFGLHDHVAQFYSCKIRKPYNNA